MSEGAITPPGVYSRQVMMRQQARSYRPAKNADIWDEVALEVQETVLKGGPMNIRTVTEMMGALGALAVFAHQKKLPDNREIWLAEQTIEDFIANGLLGRVSTTRDSYAKRLYLLREQVLGNHAVVESVTRSTPYGSGGITKLWHWAHNQTTLQREAGCKVLLCLGRGCGLESAEIVNVRAHDARLIKGNGAVVVHVRGAREREVYCRRGYEKFLAEQVEALAGQAAYLFRPKVHTRETSMVSSFLSGLPRPDDVPRPSVKRLRATWLVDLLDHRVPLSTVMAAAGLTSLAGLDAILPFLNTAEAGEAGEYLRGI